MSRPIRSPAKKGTARLTLISSDDGVIVVSTAGTTAAANRTWASGEIAWSNGGSTQTWSGDPPSTLTQTYTAPGTYTITAVLLVRDNKNGTARAPLSIQVSTGSSPAPVAPVCSSIVRTDSTPSTSQTVRWTATFSLPVTGVSLGAFSLVNGGLTSPSLTTLQNVSSTVYIITADRGTGDGTIGLNLTDGSAIDGTNLVPLTGTPVVGAVYTMTHVVPTPPTPTTRTFLGGWRVNATGIERDGAMAINFSTMTLYIWGSGAVKAYTLPAMGGTDPSVWPTLTPSASIARWWPLFPAEGESTYPNGLLWWQGKLWAAPRVSYAPNPSQTMAIYAQDSTVLTYALPRQKFAGFVKQGPDADPLLGCGGYESGQGSQSGPSLATLGAVKRIEYQWPGAPGPLVNGVPQFWNERAPRDTNYFPSDHGQAHIDYWVAWEPRVINGALEGRWASDLIFGGGLVLPEGISYFPWMGTGGLDYAFQSSTFCGDELQRTYQYTYHPSTFAFIGYEAMPDLGFTPVCGSDLGPDGKIYLSVAYQYWHSGSGTTDLAVRVYG